MGEADGGAYARRVVIVALGGAPAQCGLVFSAVAYPGVMPL